MAVIPYDGLAQFTYHGAVYHTWYQVYGNLTENTHTPLVVLHGGPGLSHDYLLPLADLSNYSVPVIFYDQLGNGRSDRVTDQPDTFWTVSLFLSELNNLLGHFKIRNDFNLYGHSWGGMLGQEFAIQRQPSGLKHLILADTIANYQTWNEAVGERVGTLPIEDQEGIAGGRDGDNYDAWRAGMNALYAQYGCRVQPLPDPMAYSLGLNLDKDADLTVDNAMCVEINYSYWLILTPRIGKVREAH
jgi:proline-specific peptidase